MDDLDKVFNGLFKAAVDLELSVSATPYFLAPDGRRAPSEEC
jgi:hypothetical protein